MMKGQGMVRGKSRRVMLKVPRESHDGMSRRIDGQRKVKYSDSCCFSHFLLSDRSVH